jgi:AraC-like DNA-binding protein
MLTSMSPLQYQKQPRLQSALNLMLNSVLDAASAAFEIGYESSPQFNRKYSRFSGGPISLRKEPKLGILGAVLTLSTATRV